jgi:hypothetical protein
MEVKSRIADSLLKLQESFASNAGGYINRNLKNKRRELIRLSQNKIPTNSVFSSDATKYFSAACLGK